MYYLYIDESGDAGDYLDKNKNIIQGSSKFFTLGGIIIHEDKIQSIDLKIKSIIEKYFRGTELPKNFKLHYHQLRHGRFPYSELTHDVRKQLSDETFDIIKESECMLLSVTINLDRHCERYKEKAANPMAYSMLIMLERFQDFLEEKEDTGIAIYEKFNQRLRRQVEYTWNWLKYALSMRHSKELDNIKGNVKNGDPQNDPILQVSDFFAFSAWTKATSSGKRSDRWNSIKHKYYKLDHGWYKAGNVEI
jgi:hypothetical protein